MSADEMELANDLLRDSCIMAPCKGSVCRCRDRFIEALRSARARGREESARMADQEEVPEVGGLPPELIKAVLAQDTVTIERALIACVVATKRSIADAIRGLPALPLDPPGGEK